MITKQDLENIPHIASVSQVGNPALAFKVRTESGYYIHQTTWDEDEDLQNVWKTVTYIYPSEDINTIIILAEADLPENADKCGDVKPPSVTE